MNRKITLLALAGEVRLLRRERVDELRDAVGGHALAGEEAVVRAGRRSASAGEAAAGFPEELAAGAAAEMSRCCVRIG